MRIVRRLLWIIAFARAFYLMQRRGSTYVWLTVLLSFIAVISLLLVAEGVWPAAFVGIAAIALAYPSILAHRVFVPLGMWRCSFVFGWLARLAWGPDGHGGIALSAWALHRQQRISSRGIEFVARRIQRATLSSASVFAAGLHASCRGDREGARDFLQSIENIDPELLPRAHRHAGEFLLADAAETGDWVRARRVAISWEPQTRTSRFFAAVCERLLDPHSTSSDAKLIALWGAAPRRSKTRPLLERTLGVRSHGPETSDPRPPRDVSIGDDKNTGDTDGTGEVGGVGDVIARALAFHVRIVRSGAANIELDELVVLARAWDDVEELDAVSNATRSRAVDLESREPDRVSSEFLRSIGEHIATILRESGHRLDLLPTDSTVLARAASIVREDLLSTTELAFVSLEERTTERRQLSPIDEWREFLALRGLHAALVQTGGIDLRRLAFPQIHHASCNHAAWLWNERNEYLLASAIFHWLLAEATIVGDERAIELQLRNCDAGR